MPPSTSACDLLGVDAAEVVGGEGVEALQRIAERSDRAGHEGVSTDRLDGPAGDRHRGPVDLRDPVLEPVADQLVAVGAEGVGLDDVGAGPEVLPVDFLDEGGAGEVQLIEAAVDEDAAGVEHRAHRPVAEQDGLSQAVKEVGSCAACGLPRPSRRPRLRIRVERGTNKPSDRPTAGQSRRQTGPAIWLWPKGKLTQQRAG